MSAAYFLPRKHAYISSTSWQYRLKLPSPNQVLACHQHSERHGLCRTYPQAAGRRTMFTKCGWSLDPASGIAIQRRSGTLVATLNTPNSLNALTLESMRSLRKAASEDTQRLTVLNGAGRALCAGGDVWSVAKSGPIPMNQTAPQLAFFRDLFELLHFWHTHMHNSVVLSHGFSIGSGMSLCVLAKSCVASEDSVFAMPEIFIGLAPSAGGSYFLSRLPHSIGTYLGLTGARLNVHEAIQLGLVSHYAPKDTFPSLLEDVYKHRTCSELLAHVPAHTPQGAKNISTPQGANDTSSNNMRDLGDVVARTSVGNLAHIDAIERCFAHDGVPLIMEALTDEVRGGGRHAAWARTTLEEMNKCSPTAVAVSLEMIRRGRQAEGTRCRVGDRKGQTPQWQSAPTKDQVLEHFEPMPADEDLQL